MTTITPLTDLSRKHPLEIEAEQLGALAAWCDLEAHKVIGDFFLWNDLTAAGFRCRDRQLDRLLRLAETEG